MLSEIKLIEPQLKQVLYGCVEHIQATKAAFYVSSTGDLNLKTYSIATSYQFRDPQRMTVYGQDDLVDRILVKREAFFINGLTIDPRFSEMLFRQGTDRMLIAPIFTRGRLVGFIDMRDKAGKRPFDAQDLEEAKKIANQLSVLLGERGLFGLPATVQEGPIAGPIPVAAAPADPAPVVQVQQAENRRELSATAVRSIRAAREYMGRLQMGQKEGKRLLTDQDLEIVQLLLPAALAIPGAVFACFSAVGLPQNPQAMVAIANVADDAFEMLGTHLGEWIQRSNHVASMLKRDVNYPFGAQVVPVTAAGISSIVSAPVNVSSVEGLVLTVAFERTPEPQAERAMVVYLRQIEQSVEAAIGSRSGRNERELIAQKLLEPDFERHPDLVEHSRQVAMMCQRFAIKLELPPAQVENIRLSGLVHDVGLRLLDYDRLYRRPDLTPEEMRGLAEHPIVGAALVEPLLGWDIAQAVLRHHERVDGKGYPSRITGNAIPLASRIIQICDAWAAMTGRNSYKATTTYEDAARRLRDGAGTQFDENLVGRFLKSLNEIGA